jgi:hypothetical protein
MLLPNVPGDCCPTADSSARNLTQTSIKVCTLAAGENTQKSAVSSRTPTRITHNNASDVPLYAPLRSVVGETAAFLRIPRI